MNTNLENLTPNKLWTNFKHLTHIPRPSKKETQVVEFVKQFGKNLGLETITDEVGNVIIRKPATPGMENRKGIIFQAHLDMVPQKNSNKTHDFEKDAIEAYIDGDWVRANGTTLGADNGIGVAAMLSVLESKEFKHGPVECLFTIDEETGMTGAFALKPDQLKGDILLNLDSEDEGELFIGCAGGLDGNFEFDYKAQPVPNNYEPYLIKVTGMKGGHSGLDIHLGRGNSNKVLARLLFEAYKIAGVRLCEFEGGNMRNAVPREAQAIVLIPTAKKNEFNNFFNTYKQVISKELAATEPDLKLEYTAESKTERVMDPAFQKNFMAALLACPNGVIRMTDGIPGLVETSTNLSIVSTNGQTIHISCLLRSSVDTAKVHLSDVMGELFILAGGRANFTGSYPGWKPNMNSPIMKVMDEVYQQMYHKKMEIRAVHAGLECGIIGGLYPNLDMVSFGPTIRHPHSPDEKVHVESVKKFWDFLIKTMENIPVK